MTNLLPVFSTRTFLNSFRIRISTNDNCVEAADVYVNTDSIHIQLNHPLYEQRITLPPTVTVLDVLSAFQHRSAWNGCTLTLAPPSNVASPMAAPADPNEPYDDTVRFLNPGDWVDMGNGERMECENFDTTSIKMMTIGMKDLHKILSLKPSAIHGGVFIIHCT